MAVLNIGVKGLTKVKALDNLSAIFSSDYFSEYIFLNGDNRIFTNLLSVDNIGWPHNKLGEVSEILTSTIEHIKKPEFEIFQAHFSLYPSADVVERLKISKHERKGMCLNIDLPKMPQPSLHNVYGASLQEPRLYDFFVTNLGSHVTYSQGEAYLKAIEKKYGLWHEEVKSKLELVLPHKSKR